MSRPFKIISGNTVVSVESADAGVPDTTAHAGENLMELYNDAQLPDSNPNAEWDSASLSTQGAAEKDDDMECAQHVNQSSEAVNAWFNNLMRSMEASDPTNDDEPAADDSHYDGEGAGEVTEDDGVTTIELDNGTTVTIDSNEGDGSTPPTPTSSPETPSECGSAGGMDPQQAMESAFYNAFFDNLDLSTL